MNPKFNGKLQVGHFEGLGNFSLEADSRGVVTKELEFPGPIQALAEIDEDGHGFVGLGLGNTGQLVPNNVPHGEALALIYHGETQRLDIFAEAANVARYEALLPSLDPEKDIAFRFDAT